MIYKDLNQIYIKIEIFLQDSLSTLDDELKMNRLLHYSDQPINIKTSHWLTNSFTFCINRISSKTKQKLLPFVRTQYWIKDEMK